MICPARETATEPAAPLASSARITRSSLETDAPRAAESEDGADTLDFRNVVPEHVPDAHLHRRGRARATGACALHVQIDDAVLERIEADVAAVHRHCMSDPCIQQLLDLGDDLVILFGAFGSRAIIQNDGSAAAEMFHD